MDDVKKKVLLDLFASPWTVFPVMAGLTSLLVAWAIGGDATLTFAGLSGLLAGAGASATRLIFGLEKITQDAFNFLKEKERKEQEQALDALELNLRRDQDARTGDTLRELRELCGRFREGTDNQPAIGVQSEIHGKVEEIMTACIGQLEESFRLWQSAKKLKGAGKKKVLEQRERVIGEVLDTVRHLRNNLDQLESVPSARNDTDLARLREELEETIQVARRTEERLSTLDKAEGSTERSFE